MSSSSSVQSIEEDDVLCRTCYEKELSRLNLHNTSLKNIEETYEDMHIAERSVKRRCTRNLVFVESSDDDSLLEKSFESSLLQTSREDEESDGIEDEVRQSKAKNLLNAVFEVLGLPKVSDWRTMGSMRRSVTRAIEIIKETANEIDAASESTKSKNVSLSVSETDILLDGITFTRSNEKKVHSFQAWNKLGTLKIDSKMLINNIVCQLPAEKCFFGECAACKDSVPSAFLEPLLGQHSRFDDSTWMIWSKPRTPPTTTENLSSKTPTSNQILLQKVNGSIADLLEEFDAQWLTFLKHSYITTEQSNYIRTIKNGASESDTIVVHMDFAENYSLQQQNSIMQAHWTTPQATIFTIHIKVDKDN
ncbi:unnamed protein product, partial [Rotaria socialis]